LPPTHGYPCTKITLNPQKALIGKPVPNLRVRMLDGRTRELTSFRGQIVLLDFWATWCGPCLAELPLLKQIAREFSPRGVTLLAVTDEEDTDQIRKTLAARKLDLPIAIDVEHHSGEFFGVSTIPHLVLIDREGIVRDVYVGFSHHLESELREQLEKLTR
jgi:cytochrome c biogenesis protein CcmG/thiol:disulfide interchange protein DsbE